MFTSLLVILAVAYIVLKVLNTKARFDQRDAEIEAERQAQEDAARAAAEAEEEEAEIRREAVDVEAETIEDAVDFDVEKTDEQGE